MADQIQGESNFAFYDPTASTLPPVPLGRQEVVVESIGDDWKHSTDRATGGEKPSYSRRLTFGVTGTEDEEGRRLTFNAYLTAGATFIDRRSKQIRPADILTRKLLAGLGIVTPLHAPSPLADPAGYADAVKAYLDENVLPMLPGTRFEVTLARGVNPNYGESIELVSVKPALAVVEARKEKWAAEAAKKNNKR